MSILGSGQYLELVKDPAGWEFVRRIKGSTPVGIVAVTAKRELLLISQFLTRDAH
jgi:hypothetical protein